MGRPLQSERGGVTELMAVERVEEPSRRRRLFTRFHLALTTTAAAAAARLTEAVFVFFSMSGEPANVWQTAGGGGETRTGSFRAGFPLRSRERRKRRIPLSLSVSDGV